MRKIILLNAEHNLAVSSSIHNGFTDSDPHIDLVKIEFCLNDKQYSFDEIKEKYITIFSSSSESRAFAILSPEVNVNEEENNIKWIPIQGIELTNLNRCIYDQYIHDVLQGFRPPNHDFEVWSFGDNEKLANELQELVIEKKKTGTSSSLWCYEYFQEDIPKEGDISIITDWAGRPKCVIETIKVEIVKFNTVTEEFAMTEGEGDFSLEYWRKAHWEFFQRESEITGKIPTEDMSLVCENFKVIYEFKK